MAKRGPTPVHRLLVQFIALYCCFAALGHDWVLESLIDQNTGTDVGSGPSIAVPNSEAFLVFGFALDSPGGNNEAGSLYFCLHSPEGWVFSQKVSPAGAGSQLGTSVAAMDGWIFGGAPEDASGNGAIYPYLVEGETLTAKPKIAGQDSSQLGASLATDGVILVSGATNHNSGKGGLLIFTLSGGQWGLLTTLEATFNSMRNGVAVSLSSGLLLSGSNAEDDRAGYVWQRSDTTFTYTSRLTSSDAGGGPNGYGSSLAIIRDDFVAVGCSSFDKFFLFKFDTTWSLSSVVNEPDGLILFARAMSYQAPFLYVASRPKLLRYEVSDFTLSATPTLIMDSSVIAESIIDNVLASKEYIFTSVYSGFMKYVIQTLKKEVPPKVQSVPAAVTSKSEKLGYQVVFWNGIAVVSVPFCLDFEKSCDGGYILLFKKGETGDWVFLNSVRNPFRNRDVMFGATVEVNDYYMVVSAPDSNYIDVDIGVVVLYKWDSTKQTFVKNSIIRYRKTNKNYNLGSTMSNLDTITAIGVPEHDAESGATNAGCALVFNKKEDGKWGQRATIVAPAPLQDENFGHSVSLHSATRLAASNYPGSTSTAEPGVYIFDLASGEWTLSQKVSDGAKLAFGWKVAFFNDLLYISALKDSSSGNADAGSISVYAYGSDNQYEELYNFKPKTSVTDQRFGFSFSTDGTRFVVGSKPCNNGDSCNTKGTVFTFTKDGSDHWAEQYAFSLGVADGSDNFGYDVAIEGETVLASAPFDSTTSRKGKIHFITK